MKMSSDKFQSQVLQELKNLKCGLSKVKTESLKISKKLESIDSKIPKNLGQKPKEEKTEKNPFICTLITTFLFITFIFIVYIVFLRFVSLKIDSEALTPTISILVIVGVVFVTTLISILLWWKDIVKVEGYFRWWCDVATVVTAIGIMYKAYNAPQLSQIVQGNQDIGLIAIFIDYSATNLGLLGIPFVALLIRAMIGIYSLKVKEDEKQIKKVNP